MNFKKYIYIASVVLGMGVTMTACSDDDLDPTSIFDTTEDTLDPTSPTYQLDKFCEDSLRVPYNCALYYRMKDVMTDKSYNLVPAKYENSVDLAVLCKYLWFDIYDKVVPDKDFMKKYGPRIIHFIGSSAINAANGTEVLGLAESGIKISLYKLNAMNVNSVADLNDRYFHTMHHEFAHVLHQTKTYPKEFDQLSVGHYDALGWQTRTTAEVASLGFTTPYASSQAREDFAETISNYITMTDAEWSNLMTLAGQNYQGTDDGVDGQAILERKVEIARNWLRDSWGTDLDALREEVQRRQNSYSIDLLNELRQQVYGIPIPNSVVK